MFRGDATATAMMTVGGAIPVDRLRLPIMLATSPFSTPSADVTRFFETVAHWPVPRWREVLAGAETAVDTSGSGRAPFDRLSARGRTSAALRDAVINVEGLALAAWFTADTARTVSQLLPAALTAEEHRVARELLTEAALALLARPALPTLDLAVLLAPFLPLHLSESA
jgi:hypothetical protein